jgi:hypothetical protein
VSRSSDQWAIDNCHFAGGREVYWHLRNRSAEILEIPWVIGGSIGGRPLRLVFKWAAVTALGSLGRQGKAGQTSFLL